MGVEKTTMNEEQNKMFHIRYDNKEYLVMTIKMHREIMFGIDLLKIGKFLEELGSKTIIANDSLYTGLMSMVAVYEREEVSVRG